MFTGDDCNSPRSRDWVCFDPKWVQQFHYPEINLNTCVGGALILGALPTQVDQKVPLQAG